MIKPAFLEPAVSLTRVKIRAINLPITGRSASGNAGHTLMHQELAGVKLNDERAVRIKGGQEAELLLFDLP